MSKKREKKHTQQVKERKAHEQEVHEQEAGAQERLLVETPKGRSPLRFFLMLALVVFLLVVFSITGPMMQALTGDGSPREAVHVSWTLPDGEARTLSFADFIYEKRHLKWLEPLFPYLGLPQGTRAESDEDVARFLIFEDLAKRAGVAAADEEVASWILQNFGNTQNYRNFVAGRGRDVTPAEFETVLKRGLAYRRYRGLLSGAAGDVPPQEVVAQWTKDNQEYDFQYVHLRTSEFMEQLKASAPDEELRDWLYGLTDVEKAPFMTEQRLSAEIAYYDGEDPTSPFPQGLVDRYPRPDDTDPDELARQYYDLIYQVRFLRENAKPDPTESPGAESVDPPKDGESEPDEAGADEAGADEATAEEQTAEEDQAAEPESPYYAFEEVAEKCRREAPIYYAMIDWATDLYESQEDPDRKFDLETTSVLYGLRFERVDSVDMFSWGEGPELWFNPRVFYMIRMIPEGKYARQMILVETGFVVARLLERLPPTLPQFEEIRDEVAAAWLAEQGTNLAQEKLESIHEALRASSAEAGAEDAGEAAPEESDPTIPVVDLETFRSAVEAAGCELVERGFAPRFPRGGFPIDETPADRYLRSSTPLYSLEDGQVPPPETSVDEQDVFLFRYGGKRDPDLAGMGPGDLEMGRRRLLGSRSQTFFAKTYDDHDWVARTFNLRFAEPEPGEERGGR